MYNHHYASSRPTTASNNVNYFDLKTPSLVGRGVIRGQQLRQDLRINLVSFTFASATARVFAGLETTTRPARLANTVAIAHVFP